MQPGNAHAPRAQPQRRCGNALLHRLPHDLSSVAFLTFVALAKKVAKEDPPARPARRGESCRDGSSRNGPGKPEPGRRTSHRPRGWEADDLVIAERRPGALLAYFLGTTQAADNEINATPATQASVTVYLTQSNEALLYLDTAKVPLRRCSAVSGSSTKSTSPKFSLKMNPLVCRLSIEASARRGGNRLWQIRKSPKQATIID